MTKQQFYAFILNKAKNRRKYARIGILKFTFLIAIVFFLFEYFYIHAPFKDCVAHSIIFSIFNLFVGFVIWFPFFKRLIIEDTEIDRLKKEYSATFGETWYE